MKLWKKDYEVNKEVERFTVGNDFLLDKRLVKYDCIASIAHAKMLKKIGILNASELEKLIKGLNEIIILSKKGNFPIKQEDEDCHTAIENYLTKRFGNIGKKIHSCRSRNDQVLAALRLYEKDELENIMELLTLLKKALEDLIAKHCSIKLPGYTHMQKAMPTDVKTWLGAYVDAINDDIKLADHIYGLIDQSPLGSAAGYGVPVFDIDKKMTADLMGFEEVMENPIYCQHSRGKFEGNIANVMSQVSYDLNKLATDLIMFNMKEFGFVLLPKEFCTGSSIMPQKKNPDVLELIRAKYHVVLAEEFKIKSMIGNLISGYNRDLQLTKEPLFRAIDVTKDCTSMMALVVSGIKFDEHKCKAAMSDELYATEEAYHLVKKGMSFRDAYKKVGQKYSK
jgi:argininosuccinate lyase